MARVGSDDPVERARAFEVLVRAYWKPVYKHVRVRWNRSAADAQDLTQAFFARAFEKRFFTGYDPDKALFRTFLKTCLDRFLSDDERDGARLKRGGNVARISLDFEGAEAELAHGMPAGESLESVFDAEWTRVLLSSAVEALEKDCLAKGKESYFAVFRTYVLEAEEREAKPSYASVASQLGLSVTDVTNYLAWTRRAFRELVLESLRELTATNAEFKAEARAVLGIEP